MIVNASTPSSTRDTYSMPTSSGNNQQRRSGSFLLFRFTSSPLIIRITGINDCMFPDIERMMPLPFSSLCATALVLRLTLRTDFSSMAAKAATPLNHLGFTTRSGARQVCLTSEALFGSSEQRFVRTSVRSNFLAVCTWSVEKKSVQRRNG